MSESIEILSAVHGIAPRSNELLRLGSDLGRGRVDWSTFDAQVQHETDNWIQLQADSGIDVQEDGKFRWQDHLRPIVKASRGFASGIDNAPVTRWFEDNRFYRKPTIVSRLSLDQSQFETATPEISFAGPNVSLLAPATFAAICDDHYSDLLAERNVLQLYGELLFNFERNGVKRVTFEDYSEGEICVEGKNHQLADVETLSEWFPALQFALINPRNRESAIPWRLIPNLGLQISQTDIPTIAAEPDYRRPDFRGGEVWHNVINASTTFADKLGTYKLPISQLEDFGVARIVLTHTVDLECLPLSNAKDKVRRLGDFVTSLRDRRSVI